MGGRGADDPVSDGRVVHGRGGRDGRGVVVVGGLAAYASPAPGESTVVSVTPTRVLDTRDPVDLGLAGPFVSAVSQKLQVTGSVATSTGTAVVVPVGANGVLLNVTVVGPTAAGFLSVRPGDASGAPSTSSLNFAAGGNVPNAVHVALPTSGAHSGQIDITFDAYGAVGPATDVLVDVVGYTTDVGIQSLVAEIAGKANVADLAAKANVSDLAAKANMIQLPLAASTRENNAVDLVFGTYQSLVSTTLTVPSAGLIQVSGSASYVGLSVASRSLCGLALGTGSMSPNGDFVNSTRTVEIGASGSGQCTAVGAVAVGPGTYVINFVGSGATGVAVGGSTINALFIPGAAITATLTAD